MIKDYFLQSKSPYYSFLITLPLFLIYELGIFFFFNSEISYVKNGADVLIEKFISGIGLNAYYVSTSIFFLVFIYIAYRQRSSYKSYKIHGRYFSFMFLESILYALFLLFLMKNIYLMEGLTSNIIFNFILSIGAGIYEELIFRVLMIFILTKALSFIFKFSKIIVLSLSIMISSFLFSAFHFLGVEIYTFDALLIRSLAGIYLSLIYIYRGFGIVALTHAFYDLFVIFRLT
tara:strand:+ start:85 stop:780 length:696 start_codon:yes stop_codon:yes gene_type:complete